MEVRIMRVRVNKSNREEMERFVIDGLDAVARLRKGFVSIIDMWNIEVAVERKFNVSDPASQKLVAAVIQGHKND